MKSCQSLVIGLILSLPMVVSSSVLADTDTASMQWWFSEPAVRRNNGEWVKKFREEQLPLWSDSRDATDVYVFNQNKHQRAAHLDMKAQNSQEYRAFVQFLSQCQAVAIDTGAATNDWKRQGDAVRNALRAQDRDLIRELRDMGVRKVLLCYQSVLSKGTMQDSPIADRIRALADHARWLRSELSDDEWASVELGVVDAFPAKKSVPPAAYRKAYADLKAAMDAQQTPITYLLFDYPANQVMGLKNGSAKALVKECDYAHRELGYRVIWLASADASDPVEARRLLLDSAKGVHHALLASPGLMDGVFLSDFRGSFPMDIPDAVDGAEPFHFLEVMREMQMQLAD